VAAMMVGWELGHFGDMRLKKKGRLALERLRLRGAAGLRELSDTRAEKAGFSRFFHNERVSVKEILKTAAVRTAEAAAGRHALLIEDTSEVNYQAKAGRKKALGRVGNGKDVGLFIHPALALDAEDGTVFGLAGATIWRRQSAKQSNYQDLPIEEKESYRWLATVKEARARLNRTPLVTVIADREADIYEIFARIPDDRTHFLIRATHDRALGDKGRLFKKLTATDEAGRLAFDLPAREKRPARRVELAIRFTAAKICQPRRGADPIDPKTVTVQIIEAREIDPPSEKEAIVWRLVTSHGVATLQDAIRMIEFYRRRWAIEQMFRTLKSQAINIEASLLEDGAALERLAAAAMVAATMVMQLIHARGEAGWTLPAARAFSPAEVVVLRALTPQLEGKTTKQKNSHPLESLAWAAWHIARLGGWNGYASERPPGPITFNRGLKRFQAIAQGFALAQPAPSWN
jgi:hypothetical protein